MRPELPENGAGSPADAQARQRAGWRSTLVSLAVNIGLTVAQGAAGIISGSQALIADAAHSLSDLLSDFVVLASGWQSRKAPDADHQYGHLRFETAASLALGVLLLTVAAGMLWAALGKLQHPAGAQLVQPVAFWVALVALASKELLFRYMLAVARLVRSSMLVANAWHARSRGVVAGGGAWHRRQPAWLSQPRPDRGDRGGANGGAHGAALRLGRAQ